VTFVYSLSKDVMMGPSLGEWMDYDESGSSSLGSRSCLLPVAHSNHNPETLSLSVYHVHELFLF